MSLVSVAVPVPSVGALTYRLPEGVAAPQVGVRVLVPVGTRLVTGCVIGTGREVAAPAEPSSLKAVADVLDTGPFLPAEIVRLAAWVAEYYACGVGEAIATTMPPRAWVESERHARITAAGTLRAAVERGLRGQLLDRLGTGRPVRLATLSAHSKGAYAAVLALERDGLVELTTPLTGRAAAFRTVRVATITAQGLDVLGGEVEGSQPAAVAPIRLGPRQRDVLARLQGAPEGLDTSGLAPAGSGSSTLGRLASLGLIAISRRRVERDPHATAVADLGTGLGPLVLTPDQTGVLDGLTRLAGTGAFHAALLHGVTGSGKTEIYLRLAACVRQRGRGVIVLVPEIALTPAVAATFRRTFGDRVAIQHSGLSDGERHDQWHRIRRGEVDIVVGTRSAVFAPIRDLGLLIVDEEHDGSYKQDESPRYNGRDVAVMRARQAGALAVLGSATPSLETFHNGRSGRYTVFALPRRVLDRPMADVRIVDMRDEYAAQGPDVVLSLALVDGLERRLAAGEQAIVLLNRRGYATGVICRQCGATLECPNCSLSLTVHRAANRARCHYCNYSLTVPTACTACGGSYLEQVGFGTERVEAEVAGRFPRARVARVDRDTVRKRGALAGVLSRFAARQLDVLVGTQMLAKGHDFPQVTLVGVISADVGLGLADFRAAERTFQLLTQVAGRAGRGTLRGEAIVQTLFPSHYSIQHACRQDYLAFYEDEIRFREAMRYPPATALVNAVVKGRTFQAATEDATTLVRLVRGEGGAFRVLGPAPAPLGRLRGEHRVQFFLKGSSRIAMRRALRGALDGRPDIARRTTVDVDPGSVL